MPEGIEVGEDFSNKKLDQIMDGEDGDFTDTTDSLKDIRDAIDVIDGIVDAILVDTGTTLEDALDGNRVFGIFNTGVPPIGEPLGNPYFVDGGVTASGAGTTWATAVKTIDEAPALCTADQNDCIFVAPGDYDEDANTGGVLCDVAGIHIIGPGMYRVIVDNSNGAATAVFTVSALSIEICGIYIDESTNTVEGIYATSSYLHVHDCIFNGGMENGIQLVGSDFCVLEGNYITGATNDGIEISSSALSNLVYNNRIRDVGDNAIHLNGDDVDRNFVISNYINGSGGTTDVGINIALGDENMIVGNSVGGCVDAGSDTGSDNVKRDNHGEFSTIATYPVAAAPVLCVAGGVAWAYGAWAEVVAAAGLANDFEIIGIQFLLDTATQYQVAIGIGGAGVEVEKINVATDTQAVNTEYVFMFGQKEVFQVRAGTRFAVACATAAGGGVETADCKVIVRVDVW